MGGLRSYAARCTVQGEVIKLLERLGIVGNRHDAIRMMRRMDRNNDGSIDINEYMEYMDGEILSSVPVKQFKQIVGKRLKLGQLGTTWRPHANIAWMTNTGVMIMAAAVVFGVLIYFRFILVPFAMAYFLTFLIGPLLDWFYQVRDTPLPSSSGSAVRPCALTVGVAASPHLPLESLLPGAALHGAGGGRSMEEGR